MSELNFKTIEKEEIHDLHFPSTEVLKKEEERKRRSNEIERAISLGNLEHHKVKIFFEDDLAQRVVNTTIWAVTDHSIVLKQNTVIPIIRIHKLEI